MNAAGWVAIGYVVGSIVTTLLIAAVIEASDREDRTPPQQPIRDPETGLLFTETGRLDVKL